ncbi:MMPL family transporter [Salininema proteolyticum]|uniref:MMPL family transporter n=1 Tax=Salininema proteolyticum TaxID=1607685 RepID=A0ABV8U151_9ACTN
MKNSAPAKRPGSVMVRLSAWTRRRPWLALALWAVLLVGLLGSMAAVGSAFEDDHSLPGSESQELADRLAEVDPSLNEPSIDVALKAPDGIESQSAAVDDLVSDLEAADGVTGVDSPLDNPYQISEDGRIAFATVSFDGGDDEAKAVLDIVEEHRADSLETAAGGSVVSEVQENDAGGAAEGVGMLAALVILVFMFGSFLAASLPLITAVFAVGGAFGVVALLSNLVTLPTYQSAVMFLVGLGVGIDYALLIFARFRSEIRSGASRAEAEDRAIDTAGRSVLFAGSVVVVALLGLYATGLSSLQAMALGVAVTVLFTMAAAVTLLPSLIALFGRRLEKTILKRAAKRGGEERSRWWGWSRFVERHAVVSVVLVGAILAAMAYPVLSMRLGFADAGSDSPNLPTRQTHDLMVEGFGEGSLSPLLVSTDGTEADAAETAEALSGTPGVEEVTPAFPVEEGLWMSTVFPEEGPNSQSTIDLVHLLREDVLPDQPGEHLLGGQTAAALDFSEAIADSMGLFLLFVVGLSFLILLVVFRSILIPFKAAVLNVLMIGASLGVVTLVFQEGLFGIEPGPVEAFVPIMLFAIIFGLSMDYEVFLVSRMREEWARTGDAAHAVRKGLASTGSVVTAAAAIMIAVFASFILSDVRMMQQFGIGMAVAIFLDAFVIRSFAMPALMRLMGRAAWWLPKGLDRVLPHVTVEREPEAEPERQPVGVR